MGQIHLKVANGLAAITLVGRSYTILDRLANAISQDSVVKAMYEYGRNLDVILHNPKEDQKIETDDEVIKVTAKWNDKSKVFEIHGKLPNDRDVEDFLNQASSDVRVARATAAYAAGLVSSTVSKGMGSEK